MKFFNGSVKETITHEQYLQLVGLMTLASNYRNNIQEIENAIFVLMDEKPDDHGYRGFSGEIIWECENVQDLDQFLRNREVKIDHISVLDMLGDKNESSSKKVG